MFVIDCPRHAHRVMLPESRIRALTNTDAGIVVVVECWCGTHMRLRTGRRARALVAQAQPRAD